jgi:hypothetical protein
VVSGQWSVVSGQWVQSSVASELLKFVETEEHLGKTIEIWKESI